MQQKNWKKFPVSNLIVGTFQIRYVRASDAGSYECQVSTVPKISKLFHLKVVIPKVCKLWIRATSHLQPSYCKPVGVWKKWLWENQPFLE